MPVVNLLSLFNMRLCVNLQETARLQEVLKNVKPKEFKDFCSTLVSNHIGGPRSDLHISMNLPPQRQTLLELLVHLDSVLLSGNPLLVPLHQIAFQPQNATVRRLISSTAFTNTALLVLPRVFYDSGEENYFVLSLETEADRKQEKERAVCANQRCKRCNQIALWDM